MAGKKKKAKTAPKPPRPAEGRLVAVIELGTTSIRMEVAQVDPDGTLRELETLQQPVSLGKDTFGDGSIDLDTTEACVDVLKTFRRKLDEYGMTDSRDVMAVATSAVREATNQDAFLDRIYVATGLRVTVLDEGETNRYTYLAVQNLLRVHPRLAKGDTFVIEVGGGSTDVLLFREGRVLHSHSYRMGSLRLRKRMEDIQSPGRRLQEVMEAEIGLMTSRVEHMFSMGADCRLVALGGEARFACSLLDRGWEERAFGRVKVSELDRLAADVVAMNEDQVVKRYHRSYPDAEVLGPALLVYAGLARVLKQKTLYVDRSTLREGILSEMATHGSWSEEFNEQVLSSAHEMGQRYDIDQDHATQVATLACQLFDAMQTQHKLSSRYRLILQVAALLHEIGGFINNRSHHKHSMYLIRNSDIFGFGSRDLDMTALVARYHRRAIPKPSHELYGTLSQRRRTAVSQLAAMLRVADSLSRGRAKAKTMAVRVGKHTVTLKLTTSGDLLMEQHALRDKGNLFRQVFGKEVVLQGAGGRKHRE
jgi:exopolyphosphatase/guanosine-5'-triphosphate,3'-diphosphate pyrophosphatase